MTTQTIRNGTSIEVVIPTGQTLKVVAVSGTYNASVVRGTGIGTTLSTLATGASYGPYAYDSVVRLVSSDASEIDFDVAVTPSVATDTVANYSFDSTGAVTGLVGPGGVVIDSPIKTPGVVSELYNGIGSNVMFDISVATSSSGTASLITDGSVSCPDPDFPANIFQIGPTGIIDQALGSTVALSGIDNIGFWARATRSSDSELFTSVKLLLSDSTSGFTTFGTISFAIRADGKWRYHIASIQGFVPGASAWAAVYGRIRFREDDGVATTGRPLMAGADRAQIGAIRANPRGKTTMFVRFDDGLDNLVSQKKAVLAAAFAGSSGVNIPAGSYSMFELVQAFGFKANCFVLTDLIGKPGFATWDELRTLQTAGWSICVQAGANPVSQNSDGARLLGPVGYNLYSVAGDIASVTASVFTVNGAKPDIIGGTAGYTAVGGVQSFPVQVLGTPPLPLVSGSIYYALRRGTRTFSLHTVPVGLSPQDNDQGLVTITGSDTSQMTLRYAGSANDHTAILADFQKAQAALAANGLTGTQHLALNQGAYDRNVETAIVLAGFKSAQTTSVRPSFVQSIPGAVQSCITNTTITPATTGRVGTTHSGAFTLMTVNQSDGALTAAQLRQFVGQCVKYGSMGANYHHNANNIDVLLAYLDQCKLTSDTGLLEVLTVEQQQTRVDAWIKNRVLL